MCCSTILSLSLSPLPFLSLSLVLTHAPNYNYYSTTIFIYIYISMYIKQHNYYYYHHHHDGAAAAAAAAAAAVFFFSLLTHTRTRHVFLLPLFWLASLVCSAQSKKEFIRKMCECVLIVCVNRRKSLIV